jgi:CheY-like chemotaxis protein
MSPALPPVRLASFRDTHIISQKSSPGRSFWPEFGRKKDMLTREQFLKHLRSALNNLYDSDHLRRSVLAALFGVADQFDAPVALQRILTEAIESLEPADDEPSHSYAWQVYGPLYYRYVQQLSREQVADQLGISTRQLSRRTRTALEALTDILWEGFGMEARLQESPDLGGTIDHAAEGAWTATIDEELAWLKDTAPESSVNLGETLRAVWRQTQPLAARYGVSLEIACAGDLPAVTIRQLALKQALLNLISVAIHQSEGAKVCVSAEPRDRKIEILVQGSEVESVARSLLDDDLSILDIVGQLVGICGGALMLSAEGSPFSAELTIPLLDQVPVLAIDDNADTLQLLKRYTSGTRYHLVGTQDPERALELAEEIFPKVIVLDVMMPQIDGWELLASLRQHPHTSHVPVIVCTILPQEDMALSLGASGFVRKPVTRHIFLAALDRQVTLTEPQSR